MHGVVAALILVAVAADLMETQSAGAGRAGRRERREDLDFVVGPGGAIGEILPKRAESRLAGYFLARAVDCRAALEIARTCPQVRYGGSIVVREIAPT
jgi:hypothetical protein